MALRDEIEKTLRAWNAYELSRGAPAAVDFDCYPDDLQVEPAESRLAVYRQLTGLHNQAGRSGEPSDRHVPNLVPNLASSCT